MKNGFAAMLLSASLSLAPGAHAQHRTFTVNPGSSQVAFALGGSGHHVQGTFHVQSGSIDFDPGAATMSGSVVVAAGSGNSGDKGRDKKMDSDVLEVDRFAEISFMPKSYQGTLAPAGDSALQVSGIFTLHGAPHDITVPMQVHIEGSNLTAKGHLIVPYVQWGLKDPSVFILKVAKAVDIDLSLAGTVSPAN